jgi:hypothetical protein
LNRRHIKKISEKIKTEQKKHDNLLVLFQDEGRFGRINQPQACWCPKGVRPAVPFQIVREYEYGYAAISPNEGIIESFCMPYANSDCMQIFLDYISQNHKDRHILMFVDQASYHTSDKLIISDNMELFPLLAHSPELNPVEVLWNYIRSHYFKNDWFESIHEVSDTLFHAFCELSFLPHIIISLAGWKWIVDAFVLE